MNKLEIREHVSLSSLSTFGMGGRAQFFVEVRTFEEFVFAVEWARKKNVSYRVMAGGSNIIFPDEGLDCLLIRFFGGNMVVSTNTESVTNKRISEFTDRTIIADAGVLLGDVIKKAVSLELRGLETLSGIPGTIGGAVYGNAGAYGHSISKAVEKVEILIPQTFERKWILKAQCKFGYRESVFKRGFTQTISPIILRVILKLEKGNQEELEKKSQEIISLREKKYKPGLKCPGSFFKNVLVKDVSKKSFALVDSSKIIDGKIPAGWLLERVGAKGMREGGIYIADFHGNLFVNDGQGTAANVKMLARILKKKVLDRFGIELEEEVRYF